MQSESKSTNLSESQQVSQHISQLFIYSEIKTTNLLGRHPAIRQLSFGRPESKATKLSGSHPIMHKAK
jgi:hypothetical protein